MRIREIEEGLRLIGSALDILPAGPVTVPLLPVSGEGIGCAESIRGGVWHSLRLDQGRSPPRSRVKLVGCYGRSPYVCWKNASADDIDLIRASFALPASGMDL